MAVNDPDGVINTSYTRHARSVDPQVMAINNRGSTQRSEAIGNTKLYRVNPVTFYLRDVPKIGPTEFFRCAPPGEVLNVVDRPATDLDRRNHQREYEAFKANAPQNKFGTPLSEIGTHPQYIKQLEANGINSIEEVAALSDEGKQTLYKVGLNDEYQRRAIYHLKYKEYQKQLDEKDTIIANLKQEIEQLKKPRPKPKV